MAGGDIRKMVRTIALRAKIEKELSSLIQA